MKKKTGRPPVKISDEQRQLVLDLARMGTPQSRISEIIGVAEKTLRKYCQHELDYGSDIATAQVAATLFSLAVHDRNVAACCFWMKTRAGWREGMELTGKDGDPLFPADMSDRVELGKRLAFTLAQAAHNLPDEGALH